MTRQRTGPRTKDDPCEFRIVGERRDDPGHLLALGCDGRWYDYDVTGNRMTLVELTDSWAVDVAELPAIHLPSPLGTLAS